jgi:hypothetical protein
MDSLIGVAANGTARSAGAGGVLGKPTPPLLRGLNFPVMFLDQAVDRGQVGLLRRAVEPGVDLNSLEEERFQDRIAFPLISIHERPLPLFHSSLASLRETASEETP